MIKPVEKFAEDKRSILHIIYRLQSTSPGADYIDDILHNGNSPSSDLVRSSSYTESNAIGECNNSNTSSAGAEEASMHICIRIARPIFSQAK